MDQQDLSGEPCRRCHDLQEVEELVLLLILLGLRAAAVMHVILVLEPDRRIGAVPQHCRLTPLHRVGIAPVPGQMVPDSFKAALRDREGNAACGADKAVSACRELHFHGIRHSLVIVLLGKGRTAPRGIDLHLEGRIFLHQPHLARCEMLLVGLHVAGIDGKERFIVAEGIGVMAPLFITGNGLRDTARPGRNGARGIACRLGAERREAFAELCCFLFRHCGDSCRRREKDRYEKHYQPFNHHVLPPWENQIKRATMVAPTCITAI